MVNTITGDATSETLLGTAGEDAIFGLDGDDLIDGLGGNDTLDGGAGTDRIIGGRGDDTIFASAGNDNISGGFGTYRPSGDNTLSFANVSSPVTSTIQFASWGGFTQRISDFDTIIGSPFDDSLTGSIGDDVFQGGGGADHVRLGRGDDLFLADGEGGRWLGGPGQDTVDFRLITAGINARFGGLGPLDHGYWVPVAGGATGVLYDFDRVIGTSDDDRLVAGNDPITLEGGAGDDRLMGSVLADRLSGGEGNDVLVGGGGNDVFAISDGGGRDTIRGFVSGQTVVEVATADPFLTPVRLLATARETAGSTVVSLRDGSRLVLDGVAPGELQASDFHILVTPALTATAGNDTLVGTPGVDRIDAGAGDDVIFGLDAGDTFVFGDGSGRDTVKDYEPGVDVLEIAPGSPFYRPGVILDAALLIDEAREVGGDTVLILGDGSRVVLDGISKSELASTQFRIVLPVNLTATTGNDVIVGTAGGERIDGGQGDDSLIGGGGRDLFVSGPDAGRDVVFDFDLAEDRVLAEFRLPVTAEQILANAIEQDGSSVLVFSSGRKMVLRDVPLVDLDASKIMIAGEPGIIIGTDRSDRLVATSETATIFGLGGNDTIDGYPTLGRIDAGAGDDMIISNYSDEIFAGDGRDTVVLGSWNLGRGRPLPEGRVSLGEPDTGGYAELVYAGAVQRVRLFDVEDLKVYARNTVIYGNDAGNLVDASNSASVTILGQGGDDTLIGGFGVGLLRGEDGNDTINAGRANDLLYGGMGDDRLDGGGRSDRLVGGDGSDTFVLTRDAAPFYGRDRVIDFAPGVDKVLVDIEGVIDFTALQPLITETAGSAVLGAGTAFRMALIGVEAAVLTADDFLFV